MFKSEFFLTFIILINFLIYKIYSITENKLIVLTVATEETDGYLRFMRSINQYNLTVEVLGLGTEWLGGDIKYNAGGGYKINLLKNALLKYREIEDLVILFVDSYDVIITGTAKEILKRFYKFKSKIVFSAENFCWPDPSLESLYPEVFIGKKYLNSGGFIGFASQLFTIVNSSQVKNKDDDQLFYTKIFLNETLKKQFNIKLDNKETLFQNLNGAVTDIQLKFDEKTKDAYLYNVAYNTQPIIIHGNGMSKNTLNSLGNYIANSWSIEKGCIICNENKINLTNLKDNEYPKILIGIFIQHPTPFLKEFFDCITNLKYQKKKIYILVHNLIDYHDNVVQTFVDYHQLNYAMISILPKQKEEWKIRTYLIEKCLEFNCNYYFSIDSDARLTNEMTLMNLIEQNRSIIAPLLTIPDKLWSNFWGALSNEEYYARSHDYIDIIKNKKRGIWNVPYISQAYLITENFLKKIINLQNKISVNNQNGDTFLYKTSPHNQDTDLSFAKFLRNNDLFLYVSNLLDYGHLVNSESYSTEHLHNDLYEIYTNKLDWEKKYLHINYSLALNEKEPNLILQPCPDVYWFPLVTEIFCIHLIEELENYGKWSDGSNIDPRLKDGYENVPTRDIHMNQIGFEQHWLYLLRQYIRPIQEKIFIGYYHDPPRALMNFVVRYKKSEQPSLRPHHDSSTYTINIALNRPGIDYEGGGCRFIRYNCSLTNLKMGWSLIHPGKLTHYHEGLLTTKGTRYIMVSFVDP